MVLATRVVSGLVVLKEVTLSLELNNSGEFLPHLQESHQDDMDSKLTIILNMFTLGTAREAMVPYKVLFRAILTKRLVRDLDIEIARVLPSLIGALWAV